MVNKMSYGFVFYFWLFSLVTLASPTFDNSNQGLSKQQIKDKDRVEEVKKVLSLSELSKVDARLTVEGATFRPFNLYLSSNQSEKIAKDIRGIIERDLAIVAAFNVLPESKLSGKIDDDALLKQKGAEGISRISFQFNQDKIKAIVEHRNLITGKKSSKSIDGNNKQLRRLSHLIAQSIYEEFVGPENLFLLQIAAVKRDSTGGSQIVLLDFDGNNETPITEGKWQKASPYFAPDGKTILYTVTSNTGQGIVEQEIGSKQYVFRIRKPGLNLDPRVLPDNSGMLVTLSFEGEANIYRTTRLGTIIGKVTSGLGLNLSPSISPDGKEMAFVSTRSSQKPHIFVQSLTADKSTPANRVTYWGNYNQTPHYSPDGKLIAFTGRDENGVFDIFVLDKAAERVSRITEKQGRNQEPFFTPSGRFVIFTSERDNKSKPDIFISSLNGKHQYRLTNANADNKTRGYFSPVVRPKPFS